MLRIIIETDERDKIFCVSWHSTDGRPKFRWHVTLEEAKARIAFLKNQLGKDAGLCINANPENVSIHNESNNPGFVRTTEKELYDTEIG